MKFFPPAFFVFFALLLFGVSSPVSAATLARPANNLGLRGYWPFDEGSGLKVIDKSGFNNIGTLAGTVIPTWISGKFGNGLKLSDSGSTVTVGTRASFAVTSSFTYSIWLKRDATSTYQWPYIMPASDSHQYYGLRSLAFGDNIAFEYGLPPYSGSFTQLSCGGVGNLPVGEWRLFTVTYDGSNLTCYRNGVQIATAAGITINPASPSSLNFGATFAQFNGYIDDARVYARALSATEVAGLFTERGQAAVKNVSRSGLVGEWKFDEGTSTVAHDSSFFKNAMSLVNAPTWVTGKHGKAVQTDGNTSYVVASDSASLNNGSMTSSMWFTLTSNIDCDGNNNWRSLIRKGPPNAATTGWDVVLEQGMSVQFDVGISGVTSRSGGVDVGMRVGVPIFLTFTYDAATGDQKVWANGILKSTKSNTPTNLASNTTGLILGGGTTTGTCPSGTGYTPGIYDDVRIYNRALSSTEIQSLYKERTTSVNASRNGRMTNGLVAVLSFDGADVQGATAYDRSGLGNNGTLFSLPKPSIGKIGQALSFNGVDTYVSVAGNPASLQLSQGTVSAWIRTPSAGGGYRGIVSKASAYGMYLMGNVFGVYDNGTPAFRTTGMNLADNKWHHVSFSFDSGVTNGTLLYVDGVLVLTTTLTNTSQTSNLQVGRGQGGASQVFNGSIDDVRVYNRILPASEIKQLYNLGK